jgi:hypothetical protein
MLHVAYVVNSRIHCYAYLSEWVLLKFNLARAELPMHPLFTLAQPLPRDGFFPWEPHLLVLYDDSGYLQA